MPTSSGSPLTGSPGSSSRAPGRWFQYRIEIQPGHQVVTGGPYRYVRRPSYSGIALVLAGIALACDDEWSLVPAAVLGEAVLAVRIRAEERQLTQAARRRSAARPPDPVSEATRSLSRASGSGLRGGHLTTGRRVPPLRCGHWSERRMRADFAW